MSSGGNEMSHTVEWGVASAEINVACTQGVDHHYCA